MAARRSYRKSKPKGSLIIAVFWLVFIVVIVFVFMANAETIQNNFNLFRTRLASSPGAEEELLMHDDEPFIEVLIEQPRPSEQPPPASDPVTVSQPPADTNPVTQPPAEQTPPPQVTQTPAPQQTRDRAVYFTHVGSDGQILHSRTTRRLPVSETPMMDALNAMLAGPAADEVSRGIINLIPHNTRIISATVRGNTAYINFSEDFLFNTFGVEGYVAQLRQIVWTVTEFQNVNDVQILIEGRRMDYLGEGIWIGSPIGRLSF